MRPGPHILDAVPVPTHILDAEAHILDAPRVVNNALVLVVQTSTSVQTKIGSGTSVIPVRGSNKTDTYI